MSINENLAFGLYQNQPENKNNLFSTRFRMMVKRLPNTTYMCQAVSLPGLSIDITRQATPFNAIKRPAGEVKHENIVVDFIVDENLENWKEIRNWILQCSNYENHELYRPQSEHFSDDVLLTILTNTHNISHKIQFSSCFPVSLSSIRFDSSSQQTEIILATVELAFTTYDIKTE